MVLSRARSPGPVEDMTMENVSAWLGIVGLKQYAEKFREFGVRTTGAFAVVPDVFQGGTGSSWRM